MSVVDLHPEELLDKRARGEITPEERERLEAHLAKCTACRFESAVRDDFAEELAEEARISVVPLLVAGAMRAPKDAPRLDEPGLPPVLPAATPRRVRARFIAILAAAAVMIASAAGASGWAGHVLRGTTPTGAPTVSPTEKAARFDGPSIAQPPRAIVLSSQGPSVELSAEPVPAPLPPPVETAQPTPPARIAHPDPAPRQEIAAPGKFPGIAEPIPVETASTVFDAANAARRRGDSATARSLYRALQSTYPNSPEARMSLVSMARLELDRGDASAALSGFDAYLRGGGDLREDALVGRARALERLGRQAEEADAWTALVRAFPASAHAPYARARLEQATPR